MKLTQQQQQVFDQIKVFMASDASIFILRGYAGTGKTTMVKEIADYASTKKTTELMAPTGRAARVLELKTSHKAQTIHKAIYGNAKLYSEDVDDVTESEFKVYFEIAIPEGGQVAIVDEASMLSSQKSTSELYSFGTNNLMNDLLTYMRPSFSGKIIFVGDPAQLPPVGDNESQALNAAFFNEKDLKVMQAELTEVIRQNKESAILKNAFKLRDLINSEQRNLLVFEEKENEVVSLKIENFLAEYMKVQHANDINNCVLISYTNESVAAYNKEIRQALYGEEEPCLRKGDILQLAHNHYKIGRMNGEMVEILSVGDIVHQSAPVYVQDGGYRVRKIINFTFQEIEILDIENNPYKCYLSLDLLNNGRASMTIDEQKGLFINFCMRNPKLRRGTEEFKKALTEDPFFNCIWAKYGYAITGHKCQGGEWDNVFVDYAGRTGLDDDCLRWAYTATTRARKTLYFTNLPHITPFSKFRIEPIQQAAKMNDECIVLGDVPPSPFHKATDPNSLHAKCGCIMHNMEGSPYQVQNIESKPYQEIYYISTPDGVERYDVRYKKGGVFLKVKAQTETNHSRYVTMFLNDEHLMPLKMDYTPSSKIHEDLYILICSACDGLNIRITNIVEHLEDYSVIYYFRTSNTYSYIKIYIDKKGFVSYAKPMSLEGVEDHELQDLIDEIQKHFE